jgi:GNAT superfamily N-acetyltransferase
LRDASFRRGANGARTPTPVKAAASEWPCSKDAQVIAGRAMGISLPSSTRSPPERERLLKCRDRNMPNARWAREPDLAPLLELFRVSEVSTAAEPLERAADVWRQILSRDDLAVWVSDDAGKIVATCMLITAPNLLRAGRRHGFLENVVTHPEYQGRGHGRAVVAAALADAWRKDCHHVLMQSGRKDPRVHRFYEGCGFVPGLRVGYVAHRPAPGVMEIRSAPPGSG